ncbi:autotransporter outer membrane beta-barrel domain-containing protein [uncultured Fusobacterium sp.]|uniref:autotransporter outer membrane beta-barrel domain-containing protein n=1 Tax=uncultured Fusobacterium sp. TaxID=159267 RepID=UPI00259636C7|nr:autotransporter outer membrane beta-barrel domain-containing protein [uncultured Fusobacterium sp.]
MNRNIINFILILAASSQLFASTTPVYKKGCSDGVLKNGSCDNFKDDPEETGMPHYQDPPLKYYVSGAVNFHQGMLHAMDETNRKNGKLSHYYTKEVDNSDFSQVKVPLYHDRISGKWFKKHEPYFFFNAGTEVKDLVFKPKEDFEKEVEKAKAENKTKMLLEGRYNTYMISGTFRDTQEEKTYGIVGEGNDGEKKDASSSEFYVSVEDFKKHLAILDKDGKTVIGKKSQKEINAFFAEQEKVKKAGYRLEDGKLVDKDGYEVFIDVDLVTIQNPAGSTISKADREKRDEVYSKRFVYEKTPNERLLYTTDGDLIIEDNKGMNDKDKKENGKNNEAMERSMLFLGQGLIKGTLDMGKKQNGKERVAIFRESGIGRYGSNIVMGPESSFKNVDKIQVGGGGSSELKTGIASLTIDIDPNSRGENGALNKNALKNSSATDNGNGSQNGKIEFESSEGNKEKYYLELMASRVGKDEIVDLGQYNNLKYISDSIAHRVIVPTMEEEKEKKEGSTKEAKNTMVSIQMKDSIKRLSDEKNDLYKSIKDSGQLAKLHETLTNSNKKTRFTKKDMELMAKNDDILADAILNQKNTDETVEKLSQFHLTEKEKEAAKKSIEEIQKNDRILEKSEEMKDVAKLSKDEKFQKLLKDLKTLKDELEALKIQSNSNKTEEVKKKIEKICDKEDCDCLKEHKSSKYGSTKPEEYKWSNIGLDYIEIYIEMCKKDGCKSNVDLLTKAISGLLKYSETYTPEEAKKAVIKELNNGSGAFEYDRLKQILQYTIREEEALEEFKTILSQIQDTNVYSKLNKISNSEITTYTSLPFEIRHSLTGDKRIAKGGFISSRTVQSHWKGNIYTGYGLYEKNMGNGVRAGLVFGGANTNYKETYSRTAKTVSTNSDIKGVSAYAGGYINKPLYEELRWITGAGVQYGRYTVKRDMKNHYQQLSAKGNANVGAFNTYSGLILFYPLQEDVEVQVKGLLSYSFIHQGKIHENGDLNLNIQSKNYHYLDSEIGVSLNKTLYDSDRKSNLSAGISAISGLAGYKNKDLSAKVSGANSSFHIIGDKIKKDAVKILLDYNVQLDAGMTYGLEGTYITNDEESNVKIGLKAGYTF